MTPQKLEVLRQQGLLTYSVQGRPGRSYSVADMEQHWEAMKTDRTPTYQVQRRLAGLSTTTLLDRLVRRARRMK